MTHKPPQQAVDNGHRLEWDPPAGLTAALRWTCGDCYATAINYDGNEYGSAVNDRCTGGAQ